MTGSRISGIWESLTGTVRRFPLAVLCSILFTVVAQYHMGEAGRLKVIQVTHEGVFTSLYHILFFGCFWFISLRLFLENNPSYRGWFGVAATLVFTVFAAAWYSNPRIAPFEYDFACLGAVLLMFVAPYVRAGAGNLQIWTFAYHLFLRIAFTFLAAVLLYVGLIAIVGSIEFLFGYKISEFGEIYFRIWIAVAALFSPIFAMAGIPEDFTAAEETYPRFLRILVCNFTIPLWCLYALVVYAYIIKIVLTWQLPEGGVALLVSCFGVKAIAVYLSVYPLHRSGQAVASRFGRHWPKLLAAPLVLLAVGITVRIREHGVTEDRYAIALSLLWMLIAMAEKLRSEDEAPRRILLWGAALLFITSFGPWGVGDVPTSSQTGRLKEVLERNGILADGKIIPASKPVKWEDRREISSIVQYLVDANATGNIRPWFGPEHGKEDWKDPHFGSGIYKIPAQQIVEDMGLTYVYQWDKENQSLERNLAYNRKLNNAATRVAGYDYMAEVNDYASMCNVTGQDIVLQPPNLPSRTFTVSFEPLTSKLTILDKRSKEPLAFNLAPLFGRKEWARNQTHELTADSENAGLKGQLIIKSAFGSFDGDNARLTSLNAVLLLKLK